MQHPMSVFLTKTLILSFLIHASLFKSCGFHKQQVVAEELFITTKDVHISIPKCIILPRLFEMGAFYPSDCLLNCALDRIDSIKDQF